MPEAPPDLLDGPVATSVIDGTRRNRMNSDVPSSVLASSLGREFDSLVSGCP